jgi:hypothetical protein
LIALIGLAGALAASPVRADLGEPLDPLADSYLLQSNDNVTTSVAPVPIAVYGGLVLMSGMGMSRYIKNRRRG